MFLHVEQYAAARGTRSQAGHKDSRSRPRRIVILLHVCDTDSSLHVFLAYLPYSFALYLGNDLHHVGFEAACWRVTLCPELPNATTTGELGLPLLFTPCMDVSKPLG